MKLEAKALKIGIVYIQKMKVKFIENNHKFQDRQLSLRNE